MGVASPASGDISLKTPFFPSIDIEKDLGKVVPYRIGEHGGLAILSLKDIDDNIAVIEKWKSKLQTDPDAAAKYLADVLNELSKTCSAVDSEITNYLGIWFIENDAKGIADNRRFLIGLEGGKARVRMAEARGHCSKIGAIYERKLKRWFKRVFKKKEFEEMELLFRELCYSDSWVIKLTEKLADWLSTRASQILDILDQVSNQDYSVVNNEIGKDRKSLLPERQRLSDEMLRLFYLQADFVELSGAL